MIKALILDAGGVLVHPLRTNWLLPEGLEEILGGIPAIDRETFKRAHAECAHILSEDQLITAEGHEIALRTEYTREMARRLNYPLTDEQAHEIAVHLLSRHKAYDDALPMVAEISKRMKVGVLSDSMPALMHTFMETGLTQYFSSIVISSYYGFLKPDPRMYLQSLADLRVKPEEAVFVDDLEKNLIGAKKAGIRPVRMMRPFYTDEEPAPFDWDGPTVHDLSELNDWLKENEDKDE